MRTAKYHDYTVLRIVLFIVLVILGLFIYLNFIKAPLEHTAGDSWLVVTEPTCDTDGSKCRVCTDCGEHFGYEIIPATGHTALAPEKQNEKAHTTTSGGSYDSVTYCKDCGVEMSREKVYVNGEHTVETYTYKNNEKKADCVEHGTYELITVCLGCDEVIEFEVVVTDPIGHNYTWELLYDESTASYTMIGDCDVCDKDGSTVTYTEANGLKVYRDTSVSSCCLIRYTGEVKLDGKTYHAKYDFVADKNHTVTYHPDEDSLNDGSVTALLPDPEVDWRTGKLFYDITKVDGIKELTDNVYDEYGFGLGSIQCTACEKAHCSICSGNNYRFVVNIYNPEYDTYLYPDVQD